MQSLIVDIDESVWANLSNIAVVKTTPLNI